MKPGHKQRLSGPTVYRSGDDQSAHVVSDEERTFRISFSSEMPYERRSWFEDPWIEVLGHRSHEVDLSRFESGGAPLLFGHIGRDRENHVGVIERAWIEHGRGMAEVRLSKRADVSDLWNDVKDGIVKNVSVGYNILERTLIKQNSDGPDEYRVTRWEPMEASLVPIPADATVGVGRSSNSAPGDPTEPKFKITDIGDNPVKTKTATGAESVSLERDIIELCDKANLNLAFARELLDTEGIDLNGARVAVIDKIAEGAKDHGPGLEYGQGSNGCDFRSAAVDAILIRSGIPVSNPHPASNDLRGMSIRDMARTVLTQQGVSLTGMGDSELFKRALHTSDFPLLLSDAANKALRAGMEAEETTHRSWVKISDARDFKQMHRLILGSAPDLEEVAELGEYDASGGPLEDAEGFAVVKYGRIMKFSWESFVNDDLSAFTTVPQSMAMAAMRKEADITYQVFTANSGDGQTMNDANPLFHASHANLTTAGSDLDATLLDAGRALLRKQTGVGGGYLNLRPQYLIVSPDFEGKAERLVHDHTIVKTSTSEASSGWISSLIPVVEPRLDGTAAYLAANAGVIDTVELAVLADHPLVLEEREFVVDALSFKVRHAFGRRCTDWRGLVKMPLTG